MKIEAEICRYLERYRGSGSSADTLIIQAGNALLRYNVNTMREAAGLSDEKILNMRNVGVKTKAFIRQAVEVYQMTISQLKSCLQSKI